MAPSTPSVVRTALRRSWTRWRLTLLRRTEQRLLRRQARLEQQLAKVRQRALRLSPPPVLSVNLQQLERMRQLGELVLKPSQVLMLLSSPPPDSSQTSATPVTQPGSELS